MLTVLTQTPAFVRVIGIEVYDRRLAALTATWAGGGKVGRRR
jgi:hypothetical protein